MRYTTLEATQKVNRILALPASGSEQDWAIELANGERLEEFIAAIENDDWSDDEKFAICSLVVSSFEDFVLLRRDSSGVDDLYDKVMKYEKRSDLNIIYSDAEIAVWKRIHSAINQDKDLYSAIIEYWKIEEESSQIFSLTPLFRSFF